MKRRLFVGFTLFALLLAFAANAYAGNTTKYSTDNGDGTITQVSNGLIWQKKNDTRLNWQEAVDYCNNNTAGLPGIGWRMPTIDELEATRTTRGLRTLPSFYWSKTSHENKPGSAWGVDFADGFVRHGKKKDSWLFRCVRY